MKLKIFFQPTNQLNLLPLHRKVFQQTPTLLSSRGAAAFSRECCVAAALSYVCVLQHIAPSL
jgi:hypothetical protein